MVTVTWRERHVHQHDADADCPQLKHRLENVHTAVGPLVMLVEHIDCHTRRDGQGEGEGVRVRG